jgi:parallel beta-helix repeat protein
MMFHHRLWITALVAGVLTGCGVNGTAPERVTASSKGQVTHLRPGPNSQQEVQTALIKAKPGDVIEFAEGTFEFTGGLSLAAEGVTVRGQGMDHTTLSFKKQDAGPAGLQVTRGKFLLEDLSIDDAKGDAVKVNDGDGVTFRRVRAQWTGGSKSTNGAYGIYPVQCKNVLIDECIAIGASDAGIYVGQSQNVIVRKCRAERNVAGIEIENCTDADVHDNVATDNAGGLLVFDLPGLPVKNGKRVRVFHNQVVANNHENFAPKGNIVASVAPGTGLMVMATDQVEAFDNTIKDNQSYSVSVVSFYITGRPIEDKEYDPIPEGIFIHDNVITGGGQHPAGDRAPVMIGLLGKPPLPDIIYDGIQNPARLVDGKPPNALRVYVKNNGKATFANLHWDKLDEKDPIGSVAKVERSQKAYEGELPPLPPVRLVGAPESREAAARDR